MGIYNINYGSVEFNNISLDFYALRNLLDIALDYWFSKSIIQMVSKFNDIPNS